jgi:hypothetical protein
MAQVVACLPSKLKVLSSNSSTSNNKEPVTNVMNSIYLLVSKTHIYRDPFVEDCDSSMRGLAVAQAHNLWPMRNW